MGKKLTAYEFAVQVNNEAIEAFNKLTEGTVFIPFEGNSLFEAKEKLDNMDQFEREHRTHAMAYIVDVIDSNIYDALSDFDPDDLLAQHLITDDGAKKMKAFKRKMVQLSNRVKAFDKKLSA